MNTPLKALTQRQQSTLLIVGFFITAVTLIWLSFRVQSIATEQDKLSSASNTETANPDPADTGWNTTITSGKNGFSLTVPDGWGPLVRDTGGDVILMRGTTQPDVKVGNKVTVIESAGTGSDSLSLFTVFLTNANDVSAPRGEATEFTIGKAEEAIVGKKYLYRYETDEIIGIGHQRYTGDRDYQYVFSKNGQELHVFYSVYGSDPRNLATTVDEIVHRIQF